MFFKKKTEKKSQASRRNVRFWMQRVKKAVFLLLFIGVLCGGGYYLYSQQLFGRLGEWAHAEIIDVSAQSGFRVREILVTGRAQIDQADLLQKLDIRTGMPIFSVAIGETQKNLSGIPWIKSVSVSRRLPDRIVVNIVERMPAALWQHNKQLVAIDMEGQPLTDRNLDGYRSLPLLVGADAPKHAAEILTLLAAEPEIANYLASAARIGDRRWDLHLTNGLIVKLPEEGVELALSKAASYQRQQKIFDKNLVTIDLRIPDKFVVAPQAEAPQTEKITKAKTKT